MIVNIKMNIIARGKYSKHVALFAKLLHIPDLKVQYVDEGLNDEMLQYYKRICNIVKKEINFDIVIGQFEHMKIENPSLDEGYEIDCSEGKISDIENAFLKYIKDSVDLYGNDGLKNSIEFLVKRESNEKEISFHTQNNYKKNINMFTWIVILNLCDETKEMGYRNIFTQVVMPKCGPRIAVILCGFLRNHKYTSHIPIINSCHVDIFIHTWDDYGFKNERRLIEQSWLSKKSVPINEDQIRQQYKPVAMLVENNAEKLKTFSLKGKISPVFLYSGQAKDDATKYINSQLYSIYSAYQLVCKHEEENNFKYDAILRMRFDYNLLNINWTGILEDITTPYMFFPHAACNGHKHSGGGGGCLSCDKQELHDKHTNDICDIWFYGKRDVAAKACEVFLHGLEILEKNHDENMLMLSRSAYSEKDGFVYISSTKDIEDKFVAFYPERLLREALEGIPCKSSRNMSGRI
jgi:hypothetical protein